MVPVPSTDSRNIKKWLKFTESSWPQINGILFGALKVFILHLLRKLQPDLVVKPFIWIDTNLKNYKSRHLLTTCPLWHQVNATLNKIATPCWPPLPKLPLLFLANQMLIFLEANSARAGSKGWATGLGQSQKSYSPSPVKARRPGCGPGTEPHEESASLTSVAQPTWLSFLVVRRLNVCDA